MIALSVNLNKIALIRNSRDTTNPDVPQHARMCIDAGAHGITVHPRPDQRHIRAQDCFDLASMLSVEFNIEGNPVSGPRKSERPGVGDYPGFMELVREIRPAQCTLVPDGDNQLRISPPLAKNKACSTVAKNASCGCPFWLPNSVTNLTTVLLSDV